MKNIEFEKFYYETNKRVYYLIYKLIGDKEEAKDLLQESYVSLVKYLDNEKTEEELIKLLNTIARNKCIDYLKKNKELTFSEYVNEEDDSTFEIENTNEEFIPDAAFDKKDLRDYINKNINELPGEQRLVLMMFLFEGMKIKEIAETLGISESTVKSRLKYGRNKLQNALTQYEDERQIKLHSSIIPVLLWVFMQYKDTFEFSIPFANVFNKSATEATKAAVKRNMVSDLVAKLGKKGIAAITTAALVGTPIVYTSVKEAIKLNPFDYVEVAFSGLDGYGKLEFDFDEVKLVEKILGEEPNDFDTWSEYIYDFDQMCMGIDYEVSSYSDLSNGDEVVIEFIITDPAKDKVKEVKKTYKVNNLKEVENVDPFSDLEVKFEGVNGEGNVLINNLSSDEFVKKLYYYSNNDYDLSNGDVITISVNYDEQDAYTYGKIPSIFSKEYTVSGLSNYALATDINEDLILQISNYYCKERDESNNNEEMGFGYSKVKFYEAYFQNSIENNLYKNILTIIIWEEMYDSSGVYMRNNYYAISYYDVAKTADGNLNIIIEDNDSYSFGTDIDYMISKIIDDSDYETTKLK